MEYHLNVHGFCAMVFINGDVAVSAIFVRCKCAVSIVVLSDFGDFCVIEVVAVGSHSLLVPVRVCFYGFQNSASVAVFKAV